MTYTNSQYSWPQFEFWKNLFLMIYYVTPHGDYIEVPIVFENLKLGTPNFNSQMSKISSNFLKIHF
jgi:hypothetical protein